MGHETSPTSRNESDRRERDAIERLAAEDAIAAAEARKERSRLLRLVVRIGVVSVAMPLLIVVLNAKNTSPQSSQSFTFASIAAGVTGLTWFAVWLVFGRRSLRERSAAIRARRAGLCTCNYPRPPGTLKCPECGGEMVMK